eukprot:gene12802-16060_t
MRNLYRTEAFAKDLDFYLGPSWRSTLKPSPEVVTYQNHLRSLAAKKDNAYLLLSHSYTQHLAMVAGGQPITVIAPLELPM